MQICLYSDTYIHTYILQMRMKNSIKMQMALEKSHCDQNRNANALERCKNKLKIQFFFYQNCM